MMPKFDHDRTHCHRVINKWFGVEECWSCGNSLPFLHFKSFTEYSFRIPGYCACVTTGYGKITAISEIFFCDQFVMVEWQTIRRVFGVKMKEF